MSAIVLKEYKEYKPLEVLALYKSVYWSLYVNDPDKLKKSYDNSLYTVGAYIDNQLVGMVRVLGDGVTIVFFQDVLVHSDYQRQGIGTLLMKHVLDKYKHVRQKALMTDDSISQKTFYRSVGLKPIQETKGICFVKYTI